MNQEFIKRLAVWQFGSKKTDASLYSRLAIYDVIL